MVAETAPSGDGQAVTLRATDAGTPAGLAEADPPAYADTTVPGGARRPIIPAELRRENIAGTLVQAVGLHWHRARYHGIRSPWYAAKTLAYAVLGAHRLTIRLFTWWHWTAGWQMESQAVAAGRAGHHDAMRAHTQGLKTRGTRGRIVAVTAALGLFGLLLAVKDMPLWGWPLTSVVLVLVLARHGKPEGKPLIRAAVVPPQYEPLSQDIMTRALASLGLAGIDRWLREGREIAYLPPGPHRDGPGWRLDLDLPHGTTAQEVIERRDKLASGLRRPLGCVWPEGADHEHTGRLVLYVCDQPLNRARQPVWPLAKAGRANIFAPVPFGTDQRGRPVAVELMFANLLIGSIPRMGKTVTMRNVLLAAALDPLAELHVWELKGTGDLGMLGQVAHAYGSGVDDETIGAALADLRKVYRELERRAKVIRELPRQECPESKVTPELAARRSLGLHPLVFAIDECQEAYSHPEHRGV